MDKFKIGDIVKALVNHHHDITHEQNNWTGIVTRISNRVFSAETLTCSHHLSPRGKIWTSLKLEAFELIHNALTEEEEKYQKGFDILCEYTEDIPDEYKEKLNDKLLEIGL